MSVAQPPGEYDHLLHDLGDTDGVGVVANLVSTVLLVSRNSGGEPASIIESTTVPTTTVSSAPALATTPPMVATVPPSTTESPTPTEAVADAPALVAPPTHSELARMPEIGVTRTPVTRQPISVRPAPVPAWPHY